MGRANSPSYSSTPCCQEDLLRLGYPYKSLATVAIQTSDKEAVFKARAAQKAEGNVLASSSLKLIKDAVVFTPKRRSDGQGQYTLEYSANADLKVKVEGKTIDTTTVSSKEYTTSAEWKQKDYILKAAIIYPNTALRLTGTTLRDSIGFGFDGKFAFEQKRFVAYNFAGWHAKDDQVVVVKHNGSNKAKYALGELTLSYYRDVSSSTHLCALAKFDIPSKSASLDFGGDHQVDSTMTIRGKVSSSGLLGLGLTKKLADCLKLTVGAQFDLNKAKTTALAEYKFGFKLESNSELK